MNREEYVVGFPAPAPRCAPDAKWVSDKRASFEAVRGGRQKTYVVSFEALDDAEALALFNECDAKWFHGGDYDARELERLMQRLGIRALPGLLRYARGKLPSAVGALSVWLRRFATRRRGRARPRAARSGSCANRDTRKRSRASSGA